MFAAEVRLMQQEPVGASILARWQRIGKHVLERGDAENQGQRQ
jgi:hypothetical protein